MPKDIPKYDKGYLDVPPYMMLDNSKSSRNRSNKSKELANLEIATRLINSRSRMLEEKDKKDALLALLDLCSDDVERKLVEDMVFNFNELDDDHYQMALNDVANAIIAKGFLDEEVLLLSMTRDSNPDSSQGVIHRLELILTLKNHKYLVKNNFNKHSIIAKNPNLKHIIMVDDFIGSGKTCLNRFNTIKKTYPDLDNLTVSFFFTAGMKHAIDYLKAEGVDVYCSYVMNKGISEFYAPSNVNLYKEAMLRLESKLADKINDTELSIHSLGYGKAEALFCRRYYNIPNNTFPIFWWKEHKDGSYRKTLYHRVQDGY